MTAMNVSSSVSVMEETGMSRKMIEDAVRMSGFKIEDIDNNAKDSL